MKKLIFLIFLFGSLNLFSQISPDKQKHFMVGAGIAGVTYAASYAKHQNHQKAMTTAIISSLAIGILKELSDSKQPNDYFNPNDAFVTTLGGVTIGVTINLLSNKPKKRRI